MRASRDDDRGDAPHALHPGRGHHPRIGFTFGGLVAGAGLALLPLLVAVLGSFGCWGATSCFSDRIYDYLNPYGAVLGGIGGAVMLGGLVALVAVRVSQSGPRERLREIRERARELVAPPAPSVELRVSARGLELAL